MKTCIALMAALAVLSACSTALTQQGSAVVMIDNPLDHKCTFVGSVAGSNSLGAGRAEDAEGAMNEMRNKAAQLGANAVQVMSINSNANDTVVIGKALKCSL